MAIARAFAVAIGIYSCPGVKPVLACECILLLAGVSLRPSYTPESKQENLWGTEMLQQCYVGWRTLAILCSCN